MRSLRAVATISSLAVIFAAGVAYAWTGPTQSAPNGNAPAPLNVSGTDQTKAGGLTLPWLSLAGGTYLTFGTTGGVNGYGMRDNGGTIEFKNSGGSWQSIQSMIYNLGGGLWTTNGTSIYYNGGKVGIGTSNPQRILQVSSNGGGNSDVVITDTSQGADLKNWAISNRSQTLQLGTQTDAVNNFSPVLTLARGGAVGVDTSNPRAALEVNGQILNTTAYNANVNLNSYDVGVGTIGAGTSIYSYGSICTGNGSGYCNGSSGVVIGGNNTSATVNIPSSGTTFFNGGNVGVGTASPNSKFNVVNSDSSLWGTYVTSPSYGIYGQGASYGVYGDATGNGYGVRGYAASSGGVGVFGQGYSYGVQGQALQSGGYGVYGQGGTWGGYFTGSYGLYAQNTSGYYGELANGSYGLYTNGNTYAGDYYSSAIGTWLSNMRISHQLGSGWYTASNSCGSSAVMYAINYSTGQACLTPTAKGGCSQYITTSYIAGVYCRSFIY